MINQIINKMTDSSTALNTSLGAILSIIVANPVALADAFIVGFAGALGAFVCSLLTKWIVKKIVGRK